MVAIALLGLGLAMLHQPAALAWFLSAVLALSILRTTERLGRDRSRGMVLRNETRVFLESIVVCSVILVLSLMPGLFLLMPVLEVTKNLALAGHGARFRMLHLVAIAISAMIAIPITSHLRRKWW